MADELASNSGYGQLKDLMMDGVVFIDEIGADRDKSGHVRDCLSRLLGARVGKWTVITSNKTLKQISEDIDTRISSRMIRDGNETVIVDVPDYWTDK